jgi:thiol-disulfide isomerase/thioredoxin
VTGVSTKEAKDKRKVKDTIQKKRGFSKAEKIAVPIIIILAIWGAYSLSQPAVPSQVRSTTKVTSGGAPSDFTLPAVGPNGLTGQSISLSSFRGKVVVIEFMEPWCVHCQGIAPDLERLYRQYGQQNVVFISVAGPWSGPDGRNTNPNDVANFIKNYGTSWSYVFDASGVVMNTYGVTSTPTFVIIGKNGSIFTSIEGGSEQQYNALVSAISQALK